jgi:peptide/nickel transport system substrate-binding protein
VNVQDQRDLPPRHPTVLYRRRLLGLVGAGASISLLAACQFPAAPSSTAAAPTTAPAAAAAGAPTVAPASTAAPTGQLVIGPRDEIISLDPINSGGSQGPIATPLLYDTLIFQGDDGKLYPGLADSWEASADATTFTFKLKQGVKFHDGTPFNAEAVQFNLDRLAGPIKAGVYISIAGIYDHTEVVDQYTAKVVLNQPLAAFYFALCYGYAGMASPTAVQKYGADFDTHPVGTGPFIFVEWIPKTQVTYKRNPDYKWGSSRFKNTGAALIDTITTPLIPDQKTRLATLEKGELHIAQDINPGDLDRVKSNPDLYLVSKIPTVSRRGYQPNAQTPPWNELAVRQAALLALDGAEISNIVYGGALPPTKSIFTPGTLGYDAAVETTYKTDRDKAKALLDAAGWMVGPDGVRVKDGKRLQFTFDIVGPSIIDTPTKIAEVAQAQLKQIGMDGQIKQYDTAAIFAAELAGNFGMDNGGNSGPDPDAYRAEFDSSLIGKNTKNLNRFNDPAISPQLNKLLADGAQTLDHDKRDAIYRQVQDIILKNALVFPLMYNQAFWAVRKTAKNVVTDAMDNIQLNDVTIG